MHPQFSVEDITRPPQKKNSLKFVSAIEPNHLQGIQLHQKAIGVIQPSFILSVLGNPGSGKSTLIQRLVTQGQFYGNKFERVLFIGPTKYKDIIQDDFNTKKTLDVAWIYSKIQQCNTWNCSSILIVFDDVVSSLKGSTNDRRFIDLFYNRRHLLQNGTISLIVSGQKWNLVPTFIRSAYTCLLLFNIAKSQCQTVAKQAPINLSKKVFCDLVGTLKAHEFLYFNFINHTVFNSQWNQL